jgi:hypothetical protein
LLPTSTHQISPWTDQSDAGGGKPTLTHSLTHPASLAWYASSTPCARAQQAASSSSPLLLLLLLPPPPPAMNSATGRWMKPSTKSASYLRVIVTVGACATKAARVCCSFRVRFVCVCAVCVCARACVCVLVFVGGPFGRRAARSGRQNEPMGPRGYGIAPERTNRHKKQVTRRDNTRGAPYVL